MLAAAANNARWCDLVCRSHGLPTVMSEEVWIAPEGSPRFYPDAVILASGMSADAVLRGIDDRPGSSVKDSFADVELGHRGFQVLFDARWLFLEPASPPSRPRLAWRAVATAEDFQDWVGAAALEGVLPPGLLEDPTVRFLAARGQSPGAAGAVVHTTDGVAGVSNVFTAGLGAEAVWSDLPAVVRTTAGDLPAVGYEHGDALDLAVASGFVATGALRVWMKAAS